MGDAAIPNSNSFLFVDERMPIVAVSFLKTIANSCVCREHTIRKLMLDKSTNISAMVQFGCGLCAPSQWQNFDASVALRLQKLPVIGALAPVGQFGRFPANVEYGDIVKGLPIVDRSVRLLYCSHVLEHLTLTELRQALHHCYQYLQPGGIFRFVLPDLEFMAQQYINSTDPDAALKFMRVTLMGVEQRERNLRGFLTEWLRGSEHLWMWDYQSLARELENVGFQDIRRAQFGDSDSSEFAELEDPQRWKNELGIECKKGLLPS